MSASNRYRLISSSQTKTGSKKRKLKKYFYLFLLVGVTAGAAWAFTTFWPSGPSVSEPVAQYEPTSQQQEAARARLDQQNKKLKAVIDDWVKSQSTYEWAVVVRGLDSDQRGVSVEPDKQMRAASLYKLYLMLPIFKDYSASKLSSAGIEDCVDLMLRVSDNPCGEKLGQMVGWDRADVEINRAGYNQTKIGIAEPYTTAGETAELMEAIYNRQVGGAAGKKYIMNKLGQQSWDEGIPAGCQGCKTYNKTGDLGFVRHDAAIISGGSGAYVLVIFSDGAPYAQIAELTRKINSVMQ